jgi:Ca2+-binding EF-hand superfamily protein
MKMIKQLKAITTMGAMAVALLASAPVLADNFTERMWSVPMMNKMDKNKDGMVSRQEFLDYMGAQFDMMDTQKTGRLSKAQFTDKEIMDRTFRIDAGG